MPTYVMVTRKAEAVALRRAMSEHWPSLEWLGQPVRLASGEYIGCFEAPPDCTLRGLRALFGLGGLENALIWPAPARSRRRQVVHAREYLLEGG